MTHPVIVIDHDPQWATEFEQLRSVLANALGDVALTIEHVGSTSVPSLAAKPIIDIDVVIGTRDDLPEAIRRLATIGYTHRGDLGVEGREAFAANHASPRHNLYVCARDSDELARHLAFRNWLRARPEDRDSYADLKRRLALRFPNDIDGYCDAKRGLIESILTQALGPGFCTSRTVVRPFRIDDTPYAHLVFGDAEVMRFAAGDPDAKLEATRARLERYIAHQAEHGFSKWAVWDRDSGAYLGDAGLLILSETGEVELGYRLGRSYWGRGLATEIAGAWLEHAIGRLGLDRVIAFADPRNPASVRVMGKIGMTFDRQDHLAGMDCVVYEAKRGSGCAGGTGRFLRI
jgi:GrpB-like predicted nucleotidyltransferase (UPF0157 family)/RimJ/RimL family protein N-acetyltransferase